MAKKPTAKATGEHAPFASLPPEQRPTFGTRQIIKDLRFFRASEKYLPTLNSVLYWITLISWLIFFGGMLYTVFGQDHERIAMSDGTRYSCMISDTEIHPTNPAIKGNRP